MKKHPELTSITKNNIKNTFWKLYKEKPLEQITVKEICILSGYNRSTFYQYFRDIFDVLEHIEDDIVNELKFILDENPILFISSKEFVTKMTKLYNKNGEYLYYLLKNKSNSVFLDKYKTLIKSSFLSSGIKIEDKDIKFQLLLEFMISAVIASLSYWYPRRDEMEISQFIEFIHSIGENGPLEQMKLLIKDM